MIDPGCKQESGVPESVAAKVRFTEFGPHKKIEVLDGPASGTLRVSDQATIDALREAFEKAGWEVVDRVG